MRRRKCLLIHGSKDLYDSDTFNFILSLRYSLLAILINQIYHPKENEYIFSLKFSRARWVSRRF